MLAMNGAPVALQRYNRALLRRRFPQAQTLYDRVRPVSDPRAVEALLASGPDLVGHLDDQTQLVALVLDRDVVAVHGAAEAALG